MKRISLVSFLLFLSLGCVVIDGYSSGGGCFLSLNPADDRFQARFTKGRVDSFAEYDGAVGH